MIWTSVDITLFIIGTVLLSATLIVHRIKVGPKPKKVKEKKAIDESSGVEDITPIQETEPLPVTIEVPMPEHDKEDKAAASEKKA